MRIQHNIMAMNAYRNYTNNNSALSKNLEKLSSGYKINRAGDDAAGLAISEKMRAQITGLEGAQKNAKDGISLVQTAEGALTEVHDMLNRMYSLAEQSANGTYDNETDRLQLQKEVDQLRTEIDRIADSSNFNGIKLLDGSLAGSGSVSGGGAAAVDFTGKASWASVGTTAKQVNTATFGAIKENDIAAGDTLTFTLKLSDGSNYTFSGKIVADTGTTAKIELADGTKLTAGLANSNAATADELADIAAEMFQKDENLTGKFAIASAAANDGSMTLTANSGSFDTPSITGLTVTGGKATVTASSAITTEGKGVHKVLNMASMTVYDSSSATKNPEESILTINGHQFAFVKDAASAKELGSGVNYVIAAGAQATAAEAKEMMELINQKTGLNLKQDTAGTTVNLITYGNGGTNAGGLTLQIGDTGDSFNQLNVSIGDTHAASLGIDALNIGTQSGAQAGLEIIEKAINKVSDIRGTLGATQNRLDHTINNLSVMQENIQDAESSIRDTDIADEMMDYTKNNILIQSAQAMLAQANQVPQGVLQLLQ